MTDVVLLIISVGLFGVALIHSLEVKELNAKLDKAKALRKEWDALAVRASNTPTDTEAFSDLVQQMNVVQMQFDVLLDIRRH